ncbi:MAG TPA: hypothetical protein VHD56_07515 [Tepidisphaeraceae bacterium]|nr:hypothetical protein [Tepidisphaeraceae bacterium]
MARRHIMRIELTGHAKQKLTTLSDKHGMTQVAMMSRLVEWFSKQNETVRAAAVLQYPSEIQADIAKVILKGMAEGK